MFDILVLFATFRIVGPGFGDQLSLARSVHTLMMTHTTCQGCGFRKAVIPTPDSSSSISVDLKSINDRLAELKRTKSAKPYEKQKTSLQTELWSFLAAVPIPKLLPSASSSDILKFLLWKDKSGRTKVHQTSCPEIGKQKAFSCECPSRLSAGTVDSLIGKLGAIFTEAGLGGEWGDRLGIGNDVSHPSIKNYLRSIKEEQAQARVCPKKSIPLFLDKLQRLAEHIVSNLRAPEISPISLYLLSRDLCFFSVDFSLGTVLQI